MNRSTAIVPGACLLATALAAHAQPAAIQQLQSSQRQMQIAAPTELRAGTNAPDLYPGENVDVGPQRILRVNRPQRALGSTWFEAQLDSQVFFTDNANFGRSDQRIGSGVFVNTAQAALAPTPYEIGPGKFAPAIGFISQWYNYEEKQMSALDFNAQTVFANARYLLGRWQFSLGGTFTRLLNQDDYSETYREWMPTFSVQHAFSLRDDLTLVVGDAVSYHFSHVPLIPGSSTDLNDHFDNLVFASLNWQFSQSWLLQPFFRFQYSYYSQDSLLQSERSDCVTGVGINLMYSFNQRASLRAFCGYTTKTSDDDNTADYDEMNGGIGGSFNLRF